MSRRSSRWWWLAGSAVLLAACQAAPVRDTAPTAAPETGYRLVAPPGSPQYALQPGQSAELPRPQIGHFAPPRYPSSLAHPGMPPVTVEAHLVFDAQGRVSHCFIVSTSYAGEGREQFAEAVREATSHWRFTPLVFAQSTGGNGTPVSVVREAKPFSLWFDFDFRMVGGKPEVSRRER